VEKKSLILKINAKIFFDFKLRAVNLAAERNALTQKPSFLTICGVFNSQKKHKRQNF